jgi:hypothetical protein
MVNQSKVDITPKTKVAELLQSYPELEDTLIEIAPTFSKLKNPILRKTIAKVTSLRQAAKVGNVPLGEMINKLRKEAGLKDDLQVDTDKIDKKSASEWLDESRIAMTLDARPILDAGEQPMGRIMSDLRKLEAGQIYKLITPFVPAPIMDLAGSKGFECWSLEDNPDEIITYFRMKS